MTIYRTSKKGGNFTQVSNDFINDENRISFKAKMILVYMLSKPDNWSYYESEITQHAKDGIKSTRAGMQELILTGYVVRSSKRTLDSKGQYNGYYYDIYEDCYQNKDMYPNGRPEIDDDSDFHSFDELDHLIDGDLFDE